MAARTDDHEVRAEVARSVDDGAGGAAAQHHAFDRPAGSAKASTTSRIVSWAYSVIAASSSGARAAPQSHGPEIGIMIGSITFDDSKRRVARPGDRLGECHGFRRASRTVICEQDTHQ